MPETDTSKYALSELADALRATADRWEKERNAYVLSDYAGRFDAWLRNAPIQAALQIPVDTEPEPPLVLYVDFNADAWTIVTVHGPEQHPRLQRPELPAPPPSAALPGMPWGGNNPDIRHVRAGDTSPAGTRAQFEGVTWVREDLRGFLFDQIPQRVWRRLA